MGYISIRVCFHGLKLEIDREESKSTASIIVTTADGKQFAKTTNWEDVLHVIEIVAPLVQLPQRNYDPGHFIEVACEDQESHYWSTKSRAIRERDDCLQRKQGKIECKEIYDRVVSSLVEYISDVAGLSFSFIYDNVTD